MSTEVELQLRPLAAADYEAYLERVEELDAFHRDALPDVFRAPEGPARARESFEAQVADPAVLLLGAWTEGELAGYVFALERKIEGRGLSVERRYVLLDNIAVGARWSRRGIGRALVEATSAWARARGVSKIELEVWAFNEGARRFYEDLGFDLQRLRFTAAS